MAKAESENSEGEMDLADVKRMTQEVNSYGFEDCDTPLVTWPIHRVLILRVKREQLKLEYHDFPTNDTRYVARLTLAHGPFDNRWNLTLFVKKSKAEVPIDPFPFFICKMYDDAAVPLKPKIYLPQNSFDCSATENQLLFPFPGNNRFDVTVFEIHQVSWKRAGSRSPMEEVAWGKIERFREDVKLVANNEVYLMSPLITFDLAKQGSTAKVGSTTKRYMMVRFWYKEHKASKSIEGLTMQLHLLNHEGQLGQRFEVAITIFNQNDEKVKKRKGNYDEMMDLLVEYTWELEVKGSQQSIRIFKDMTMYIDARDTLYYKIRVSLVQSN